jgi:hypothetical protein
MTALNMDRALFRYHNDHELCAEIRSMQRKLNIAIAALNYYAGRGLLEYPDDWSHMEMGGPPEVRDLIVVEDVATTALQEMRK